MFDRFAKSIVTLTFSLLILFKALIISRNEDNVYAIPSSNPYDDTYNPNNYSGVRISMTICALALYSYLYYYLMGFNSTGPFVLTIYRIVSRNIPYFIRFYIVILVGFSCAFTMLTYNGNPQFHYGFWHLLLTVWTLIRQTVNLEASNNALSNENTPEDVLWLYDIVLTAFNVVISIVFINLLIALISSTL